MKNVIYISYFLILSIVISCGQNSYEKKLNGKWYGIENHGNTIMHFYPDSLVFTEEFKESVTWNATPSIIDFSLPSNLFYTDSSKHITINYTLSKHKDTLFCDIESAFGKSKLNFLRATNYIEYLNKRHEIELSLPENNEIELMEIDPTYGIRIFIGFKNHNVIAKTEYSNSLSNLADDIKRFKEKFKTGIEMADMENEFKFYLSIYADEKISDSLITASLPITIRSDFFIRHDLPRPPYNSKSIDIYRIYEDEEEHEIENYSGFRKAKKIKTVAKTVFD